MKKVLIVEDDEAVLKLYTIALQSHGIDVRATTSAETAIQWLIEEKYVPDLMLLDYRLENSHLSGSDIAHIAHENPDLKDVPVIILTSYSQIEILAELLKQNTGGVDVFRKVYTPVEEIINHIFLRLEMRDTKEWLKQQHGKL